MQNAKDTFYVTLRDRLAGLNPARTAVVRGTVRPGLLVEEAELASAVELTDVFCLRWLTAKVEMQGAMPLVTLGCEFRYATDGTSDHAGMDRGRLLAGMDAELLTAVGQAPQNAPKSTFVSGAAVALNTKVFWSDVVFLPAVVKNERLERTATVTVWSYQEAGEL